MVNMTVEALSGDLENAVEQIALTAEDAHALLDDIRPEIKAIAQNGSRISADTQRDHRQHPRTARGRSASCQ